MSTKGRAVLIVLGLLFLLTLSIPTLLSTKSGKEFLLRRITPEGEVIQARSWSLGWFTDQVIEGLHWKDSKRGYSLIVEELRINRGLFLLLMGASYGDSTAKGAKLIVQKGVSPKKEDAGKSASKDSEEFDLYGSFRVTKGQVTFVQEDGSVSLLEDVNLFVERTGQVPFMIDISGHSKEGEESGSLKLKLELAEEANGPVEPWVNPLLRGLFPSTAVAAEFEVVDFSTQMIDKLVPLFTPDIPLSFEEMIGPKLNFQLKKEIEQERVDIHFAVKSQNLTGSGKVELKPDVIDVIKPLRLDWTITKPFFDDLTSRSETLKGFTLQQPSKMEIGIKELERPSKKGQGFLVSLEVLLSPLELFNPETDEKIELQGFEIVTKVDPSTKRRAFQVNGQIDWKGEESTLQLSGLTSEGIWSPFCLQDCLEGEWELSLKNIPLQATLLFNPGSFDWSPYLGKSFDAHFAVSETPAFTKVVANLSTENLKASNFQFAVSETLSLLQPAMISYLLPKEMREEFDVETPLYLTKAPLEIQFEALSFDLEALRAWDLKVWMDSMQLRAQMRGDALNVDEEHPFSFDSLRLRFEKREGLPLTSYFDAKVQFKELLSPWLGKEANAIGQASISIKKDRSLTIDPISITVDSARLQLHAESYIENHHLQLKSPATLVYRLTPEGFADLFHLGDQPKLEAPTKIILNLDPLKRPLDLTHPFDLHLKGSGSMGRFTLGGATQKRATLDEFNLSWDIDGLTNSIAIKGNAKTLYEPEDVAGKVEIAAELFNWHREDELSLASVCMGGKIELQQFPTALFSPYVPENLLDPFLTELFNIKIEGEGKCGDESEGSLFVNLKSPLLQIDTHFKVAQDFLRLFDVKGAKNFLNLTVTPESFCQLLQLSGHEEGECGHLYLQKPFDVTLSFTELFIPNLFEEYGHSLLKETRLSGDLTSSNIELFESNFNQKMNLLSLSGSIEATSVEEPINIAFATAAPRKIDPENVQLKIESEIDRSRLEKGNFQLGDLDGNVHIDAKQLPLGIISELLFFPDDLQRQINALLGNSADIETLLITDNLAGSIDLDLKGKSSELRLRSSVDKGILYLDEPLEIIVEMNEEVAKSVIGEIVPLLQSGVKGLRPISIIVDTDGFSLPLFPFNFLGSTLGKGTLDLHYLELRPTGELGELFSLLKIQNGGASALESVWFTPLYFSFNKGVLKVERVDMLLSNSYPLALWGTIDFGKDRVHLELGIGANTLQNAFGLSKLPDDYILPLPIRGSVSKPKLDKPRATVKIGTLIAELQNITPGGELIGGVLDLLSRGFRDEKVPPPTTDPLPWEKDQEPKKPSKIRSLFKTIEKGAQSIKELLPK